MELKMKRNPFISLLIIIVSVFFFVPGIYGQEDIEPEKTSTGYCIKEVLVFKLSEANVLNITNKHGNIIIDEASKDSIRISYDINVGSFVEDAATEVLEQISVNDYVSEKTLYLKTMFEDEFQSAYDFSINYHIFVPSGTKLIINNEFGNIHLSNPNSDITVDAGYGDLFIKDSDDTPAGKVELKLNFINGDIRNITNASVYLSNCKLNFHGSDLLKGDTRFCIIKTDSVKEVNTSSEIDRYEINYSDKVNLKGEKTIATVSGLGKNGHFEIKSGKLDVGLSSSVSSLTVANEAATTTVEVPAGLSYVLNGEVKDGKIIHYRQNALKILKDMDTFSFSGEFGSEPFTNITIFNSSADIIFKRK
jgi:hypothetical protein